MNVKYVKGYETKEDLNIPIFEFEKVNVNFVKIYQDVLFALCRLNTLSGNLTLFLISEMDNDNSIHNNSELKNKFLRLMKSQGIEYSHTSLSRGFAELTEAKIIVRISKGRYRVNPKFFWKDTDKERLKSIKLTLEFNAVQNSINVYKEVEK